MSEQEKRNLDELTEENQLDSSETANAVKETKPEKANKAKKDPKAKAKADKAKKPGFFQRLGRFFRELKSELKKVAWPSRSDTIHKTGIVVACVIVVGIIVWIFDGIAGALIDALLSLFGQ